MFVRFVGVGITITTPEMDAQCGTNLNVGHAYIVCVNNSPPIYI